MVPQVLAIAPWWAVKVLLVGHNMIFTKKINGKRKYKKNKSEDMKKILNLYCRQYIDGTKILIVR